MVLRSIQPASGLFMLSAVETPQGASGCEQSCGRPTKSAIGRTKGGLNTKLTSRVDARGRALQLTLAPGQRADVIAAEDQVFTPGKRVVETKV